MGVDRLDHDGTQAPGIMSSRAGQLLILTAAQTAGQTGWWAAYVAALPAALDRPHPAVWLGAVTVAWCAPSMAARLAGGIIDSYGPRLTAAIAWAAAAIAAIVPALTHPGLPALLGILACLSAASSCAVAAGAAAPTWMPNQPDLVRAGSWLIIATYLPIGAGPVGASNLLAHAGQHAAWALVAVLLATAAVTTLPVQATRPPATGGAPARRYRARPAVRRVLAITAGIYLSWGAVTVLEPLYVHAILIRPLPVYGWLLCTWATAAIVTAILASHCQPILTARWAVPAWALLVAAGEAIYLGTSQLTAAYTGAAIFGAGATLFSLSCRAVIISDTPPAQHGRAFSLWFTTQDACLALPAALAGPAVAALGLRAALDTAAALAAASGLGWIAIRPRGILAPYGRPARPWPPAAPARPRACRQTVEAIIMAQYGLSQAPHAIRKEKLRTRM
jgi:hypothetical protein